MNLFLIRHAKSSWNFDVIDHDRPLSSRGINDAKLVFEELKNQMPNEFEIWCSTSKRTTQTAKTFASIIGVTFDSIEFKAALYTFSSSRLEKIIQKNTSENLIIFGHNNAITDFVNKRGNYYIENVPTCGVVIIKFDALNTITTKKGVIIKTIFPRDLK